MRIADNVEMLDIKGCNPVLIWDGNDLVLIDAGYPSQFGFIKPAIESAGFSADRITKIILTHQDIDHIGNVKEIQAAAPDVKVLAHEAEAPYIDGRATPVKLAKLEADFGNLPDDLKAWCGQLKAGFANRRIPIDAELRDGEILPCCGGIEVVHTPGHTPGHICLYLRESRILVTGDAVIIADGKLNGPMPEYTQDLNLAYESLGRLQKLDISRIIAYHGGLYDGEAQAAISSILENR